MKPLKKHQERAIKFGKKAPKCGLFLSPGLGKTRCSLELIRPKKKKRVKKTLIVAPLRVCQLVWPKEIKKWRINAKVSMLHGSKKEEIIHDDADIHLLNPNGIRWFKEYTFKKKINDYEHLIVDESTMFKNARAKRTKDMVVIARRMGFKTIRLLSGTPTPQGLMDIFAQVYILDQGKRFGGSFLKFRRKYFTPLDYNEYYWEPKIGSVKEIKKLCKPLMFHASSEEADLPPLHDNVIEVELPPSVMREYKRMESTLRNYIIDEGMSVAAPTAATARMKCKQITSGFMYDSLTEIEKRAKVKAKPIALHKEKIKALVDLVDEQNGAPILIGYNFIPELKMLQEAFPKAPHIGGGVKEGAARRIEERWNAGKIPILFGQTDAVSLGLNLQETSRAICFFSLTDNYESAYQFIRRIWRQGQKGSVIVHYLIAKNTVDCDIFDSFQYKEREQKAFLNSFKKRLNI